MDIDIVVSPSFIDFFTSSFGEENFANFSNDLDEQVDTWVSDTRLLDESSALNVAMDCTYILEEVYPHILALLDGYAGYELPDTEANVTVNITETKIVLVIDKVPACVNQVQLDPNSTITLTVN